MISPGTALGPRILKSRSEPGRAGGGGFSADNAAQADAEQGSFMLRVRCQRAIDGFAAEHRIRRDEAQFLLMMTGVRL